MHLTAMYGYKQSNDNGMMTNLDSISSSLSSLDTVGQARNGHNRQQNNKTSIENLIAHRSAYANTNSAGLSWNRQVAKEDPYTVTAGSIREARLDPMDIYQCRRKKTLGNYCPDSATTTNLILIPLLLLTIIRQVFDFLGQIWLQIIINFFTIIFIIIALFGIRQNRISYLLMFTLASLFNTIWNLFVISIHSKANNISDDLLSLHSGSTSWWHTNGPGCLPYSISNIQSSISIIKSNIMSNGCKIDYHLIEATQAAIHGALSLISVFVCCWLMAVIRCSPNHFVRKQNNDRIYRMNDLTNNHAKVNQDPCPGSSGLISSGTNSLRRSNQKPSSRSSQHSIASVRSAPRRRRPSASDNTNGITIPPALRGSRNSMHRSSKYGSLSSRRSNKHRDGASDVSSLTYGTTNVKRAISTNQRTRLSSVSSSEYLPSYQPPHSSSANLLNPYGEISSIDSYSNNGTNAAREHRHRMQNELRGNTNPVYQGSKSSVNSQNVNNDNYDDISYIYGGNGSVDNPYGRSRRHKIYAQLRNGPNQRTNYPTSVPEEIRVETYRAGSNKNTISNGHNSDMSNRIKNQPNGSTFQSFSATASQYNIDKLKPPETQYEINNEHIPNGNPNKEIYKNNGQNLEEPHQANHPDHRSQDPSNEQTSSHQNQNNIHHKVYANEQHDYRYPIYTNRTQENGETQLQASGIR